MKQRGTLVVAAFVLAALATVAVFAYTNSVKKDAKAGQTQVDVVVSKQDIPAGTTLNSLIDSGGFMTQSVPEDAVVPGAITSLEQLRNQQAALPILTGE